MTAALWQQETISPARAHTAAPLLSWREALDLPATADLLAEGGDARILPNPVTGLNRYGCSTTPAPDLLAFGSSTASTISGPAFAAANRLRNGIARAAAYDPAPLIYARELDRIRAKLLRLCGLGRDTGVLFAASGTDLHLLAAKITGGTENKPSLAIMVEASETGSGVGAALGGRHFSTRTALGDTVTEGSNLERACTSEVVTVTLRNADGAPRPTSEVDAEVSSLAAAAAAEGRNVLLTMVDVSKTGLMAPSLDCILALRQRFPAHLDILVDACQFRLAAPTLRAYLAQGFMVMVTGSKFMTGPTFAGALLIPRTAADKYRGQALASGLRAYSAHADWPQGWPAALSLKHEANFGLLLRWEAALAEFSAFNALSDTKVSAFIESFASAVAEKFARDPVFAPVPSPKPDRSALVAEPGWDRLPTIFSFKLHHPASGTLLTGDETLKIYRDLQAVGRCQLGQPVSCGKVAGVTASALRLCLSSRLIVEALSGNGAEKVIGNALTALDKTAALVRGSDHPGPAAA